jgi:S-DNA-T family DNA segregation ATPase FtsK/SpoIIIE
MAKKRDKKEGRQGKVFKDLKEETRRGVWAILFFVVALFFLLAAVNIGGIAGANIYLFFSYLLGFGYFLIPLLLCLLAVSFIRVGPQSFPLSRTIGALIFLFASLGLLNLVGVNYGGLLGGIISNPLINLFDIYASYIFLLGLLIISLFIIFDTTLKREHFSSLKFWQRSPKDISLDPEVTTIKASDLFGPETEVVEEDMKEKAPPSTNFAEKAKLVLGKKEKFERSEEGFPIAFRGKTLLGKKFQPPPLSLLENDRGKPGVGDIKANANIIKRTLQNFGIDVEMDEISIGPSVTRYALKPAEGVKLSRIVGLQNNLALALAAHPIRIEAPIPGKSLVGIEIPNSVKTTVGLGSLLAVDEYQKSDKPLLVSLGKGISGRSYFGNLGKMPHLLIAGATGSGKSVSIHAIIASLLFHNSPDNLRFIMIDPKRVELTMYNKIPHLLTPVITDAKRAILSLKWAAKEMDRRYDILEKESVRDVESYHRNVLAPALKKLENKFGADQAEIPDTLPYIVIIIDELADIMSTYPRELESAIVRLAQMSRAVGIHLILSTQRPSVNIITGLIKANIPARIALQVASQIDSRTILDASGAEKLLGAGDMLYLSGEMSTPQRIQSAFITEEEVKKLVKYLIDTYKDEMPASEISLSETGKSAVGDAVFDSTFDDENLGDDDDLYEEAREIVVHAGKASTSYLQRKLRVGYARAARLIDMLEERGVVGPGEGAKPRSVIGYVGNPTEEEV